MPSEPKKCPKCNGVMECGIVIDVADKRPIAESVVQATWVALQPDEMEETKWPPGYISNLAGRERCPVVTYRCVECNFLESYAIAGEKAST